MNIGSLTPIHMLGLCFIFSICINLILILFFNNKDLPVNIKKKQNIHYYPVPRLGGISIFLSLIIVWLTYHTTYDLLIYNTYTILLILSFPTFLAGLLDDLHDNISPLTRLKVTFLNSILAIFFIVYFTDLNRNIDIFLLIDMIFVTLLMTFTPHMFNLIDGINGLLSSFSIIALIPLIIFTDNILNITSNIFIILVIVSILPFLILNITTSKIFLGDCGSYLLGFICSFILGFYILTEKSFHLFHAILILFYPIFETCFTCYRRFLSGTNIFEADANHFHSNIYKIVKKKCPTKKYLHSLCFVFLLPLTSIGPVFFYFYKNNDIIIISTLFFLSLLFYRIFTKFKDIDI